MEISNLLDNYSCEATPLESEMGITSENGYTLASNGGIYTVRSATVALVQELLVDPNVR